MNLPVDVGLRPATGRHLHLVSHGYFWITVGCKCWISFLIKNAKYLVNDDLYTHIISVRKAILIPALFIGIKRLFADVTHPPINFHLPDIITSALGHDYAPGHLAVAALRAIALNSSTVRGSVFARATARLALALFGWSHSARWISPVTIVAMTTAQPTASAERRSPLGALSTARCVPSGLDPCSRASWSFAVSPCGSSVHPATAARSVKHVIHDGGRT